MRPVLLTESLTVTGELAGVCFHAQPIMGSCPDLASIHPRAHVEAERRSSVITWPSLSEPGSLSGMTTNALVKNEVLGMEAAEDFSLNNINLLARQGYLSKRSLSTATREELRHIQLPEACIDNIMLAMGEFQRLS